MQWSYKGYRVTVASSGWSFFQPERRVYEWYINQASNQYSSNHYKVDRTHLHEERRQMNGKEIELNSLCIERRNVATGFSDGSSSLRNSISKNDSDPLRV